MMLTIASPATLEIIDRISHITGESAETAVAVAVREHMAFLDEVDAELERRRDIYALVKELGAAFREAGIPAVDIGELLYDERGLPREGELTEYELRFYFPERYAHPEDGDGGEP
jgi:hypothetical protein